MKTISLCMIVRDEEKVLPRCLESIREAVDEIILVDTGSKDSTPAIARTYTPYVYAFPWVDDFSAARNFSFSKATGDYCMWLDADDLLPFSSLRALQELKEQLSEEDFVLMPYQIAFDEAGHPTFLYYRERLIRRSEKARWEGAVHEIIPPFGKIRYCDEVVVQHRKEHCKDPDRNLRIFEARQQQGIEFSPREQYYFAREVYFHQQYERAKTLLLRFLKEEKAWIENRVEAYLLLSDCYVQTGQPQLAFAPLFETMRYVLPRPQICCALGKLFYDEQEWVKAVFWYEQALHCPHRENPNGFWQPLYDGYIPCLQLCLCYHQLGDYVRANAYNEQAAGYYPQSRACAYNRIYFQKKGVAV